MEWKASAQRCSLAHAPGTLPNKLHLIKHPVDQFSKQHEYDTQESHRHLPPSVRCSVITIVRGLLRVIILIIRTLHVHQRVGDLDFR